MVFFLVYQVKNLSFTWKDQFANTKYFTWFFLFTFKFLYLVPYFGVFRRPLILWNVYCKDFPVFGLHTILSIWFITTLSQVWRKFIFLIFSLIIFVRMNYFSRIKFPKWKYFIGIDEITFRGCEFWLELFWWLVISWRTLFRSDDENERYLNYPTPRLRSSHGICSVTKGVLRNFAEFAEETPVPGSLKKTLAQVFSCEFYEISKNNFSTEYLRTTASEDYVFVKDY